MRTTKHFIEFQYPGLLFPECEVKEVGHRDPQKVELPKGAFGFWFFDKIYVGATDDDGEKFERLLDGTANKSKTYYPGGVTHTLEEVKGWEGDFEILISNMEGNKWLTVVKTCRGNIQPFDPEKQEILCLTTST